MKDPYDILGVRRDAGEEDIKKAYRKLAKELHPDRNPGNRRAAERFKEVSAAYHILGDPKLKARFDRGEIDASGQERHPGFQRGPWRGAERAGPAFGPDADIFESIRTGGFEDLFGDLFGGLRRQARTRPRQRGADRRYTLRVSFLDAARGGRQRITLPGAKVLDVNIPAGIDDGQQIRLKAQGEPGVAGGPPGDALIEVGVDPHPFFRREGRDVHLDLPVTISEAVLGGQISAPTIDGMVNVTVPKGANSGTRLRLKGKGIPDARTGGRGDQYIRLIVTLPETIDPALTDLAERRRGREEDVRRKYRV
jgi:DnaJ-class molecular chaperone